MAREYTKAHGLKAGDIMTRQVRLRHRGHRPESEIADTLESQKIKRIPVLLRDGKLVGHHLSRRSASVAIGKAQVAGQVTPRLDDDALYKLVHSKMWAQDWLDGTFLNVSVRNGVAAVLRASSPPRSNVAHCESSRRDRQRQSREVDTIS